MLLTRYFEARLFMELLQNEFNKYYLNTISMLAIF